MREIDQYDLPLPAAYDERLASIADTLVREKRLQLLALCCFTIVGGLAISWWRGNFEAFGRSGALLTALSIMHAWRSLRWSKMMTDRVEKVVVDVFTTVERGKIAPGSDTEKVASATAQRRVSRAIAAVQNRFLTDHLLVGVIGTLIWGFGDLL
ncbi:hypothetical protein C1D09_018830 [Mesorhizobium intechi]|uniref:hypothetical protein n=1 Tax=Mesorhizobium intechi TaxID=537601 RepID=UPI000CC99FE7|nr:hypothetical protein [Mesorhizobium intechi]TSE07588.1 hypothetical protein C1D09_018830 [Mesorhizobium intechi]